MNKNQKSGSGFSLIEVIIALAVLLLAVSVFGVALSTTPLTKTSKNQNLAYHIAAKKIEDLRNTQFATLPASGPFSDPALSNLPLAAANLLISDYSGSSQIKQAAVTVNWNEGGTPRFVTLETLISQGGLNRP